MATHSAKSKIIGRQHVRQYHALLLAVIGCFLAFIIILVRPFFSINLWLADQFFPSGSPSANIVIAGIDDSTLKEYGRLSEWPRRLHARAIDNLIAAGAAVIGFDVIFPEPSPEDDILATAERNANNVVLAFAGDKRIPATGEVTFNGFLMPSPLLKQASASLGHSVVIPDPDGKVRQVPLVIEDATGKSYPALILSVLHSLFHMPLPEKYAVANGKLHLLARDIPVEDSYSLRINFPEKSEDRPYISYGDVISGNFDPSQVKNKILLIGMTATGEPDTWAVPAERGKIPGVYIHAAAMDTILKQNFLTQSGMNITLVIMLALVAITALALPRFSKGQWTDIAKASGVSGGLLIAYLIASAAVANQGYILNVLYPALILVVVYVSDISYRVVMEQSDKRFVKDLFGRYVSPQVAKEIVNLANSGELDLGGAEKEVTVLFADIRNFTRLSEQLAPEAIVALLNRYLPVVVDAIVQNGGIINKFAGDNVMAIWNAPQSKPQHALLAVQSAWEAQQKISQLNHSESHLPAVQFGIGINTGKALAGNIGSTERTEYTVIGDTVNLASRICGTAPGGEIWIGPDTYRQTMDYLEVKKMEDQTFKGKTEPVTVYQVTGWRASAA